MDTIQKAVLIAHTLIATLIIVLVLMQRGKGADAGAAFGAGASGTVFGARGSSSILSSATAILATAYFISSLTLAVMSSQGTAEPTSLLEGATVEMPVEDAALSPVDGDELPSTELPTTELPAFDTGSDTLPAIEDELPEVPEDVQDTGNE